MPKKNVLNSPAKSDGLTADGAGGSKNLKSLNGAAENKPTEIKSATPAKSGARRKKSADRPLNDDLAARSAKDDDSKKSAQSSEKKANGAQPSTEKAAPKSSAAKKFFDEKKTESENSSKTKPASATAGGNVKTTDGESGELPLIDAISKEKPAKLKVKRKKVPQSEAVRIETNVKDGLTTEQVESRVIDGLTNKSTVKSGKSIASIIFTNTFTFFNLLCAIVLAAYIAVRTKASNFMFVLPFAMNLAISIFQEIRAKLSVEKLSILQSPTSTVIRNGLAEEVASTDIVLDDIFKISTGNQIPVDGIVLEGFIDVNESLLTGESVAVKKKPGDEIMAGSFVTSGSCTARADKVADECYVQKLTAKAKRFKKPHSELMTTLSWIIKVIGLLIIPIAFGVGLVNYNNYGNIAEPVESLKSFVVTHTGSVVLGMIPAGLMLLTTMALSLGVIRLYARNTLVQDMYSLEMLARVDVLCLDKTGTITDGRMNVIEEIPLVKSYKHPIADVIGTMQKALDDNNQTAIALRAKYIPENLYIPVKTMPFSSQKKYSAVTFNEIGTYAVGAPEFILSEVPKNIKVQVEKYTLLGHRVLLLAYSPASITAKETLPASMEPVALIVLSDNIRDDAIETIKWFKENDVKVKVISGDNPVTVSEIAKRAGVENADNWISLEGLSDKEVATVADKYTVFGRVTPDQKAVLVKALKRSGHTVAMTGDGVNDILAMRESDCSITVASGADAAKNVAHIVLADNNFNSMPRVVAEGRRVINNIQQSASLYLMKTIFITVLALISILSVKAFPFESGMLTMLEWFVIAVASFVLSLQPNEKRVENDFLLTIFGNAIPGALILLTNVYIIEFLNMFGIFPTQNFAVTMQVVLFTLGGTVYLYKICKPFNLIRAALMIFIAIVMVVWVIFLLDTHQTFGINNFFGLTALFPMTLDNWKYVILLIAILELNFPLVELFFNLNKRLAKTFTGKNKNKNKE